MKKSIFCIIAVICCFQLFSQAKQTGNSAEPRKVTGIKKSQFVQQQVSLYGKEFPLTESGVLPPIQRMRVKKRSGFYHLQLSP